MARKAFDFRKVVGSDENRGFGSPLEKTFDELIANKRIEAAKWLIKNDKTRMKRQGAGEGKLHFHAAGKSFDFAVELKIELLDEGLFERGVPGGVESRRYSRSDPTFIHSGIS